MMQGEGISLIFQSILNHFLKILHTLFPSHAVTTLKNLTCNAILTQVNGIMEGDIYHMVKRLTFEQYNIFQCNFAG